MNRHRFLTEHWTNITPPVGWTWTLPFTIQRKGRRFRVRPDWNISSLAPAGKTYYVDRLMPNDLGDGLTPATAFQKLSTALGKADVDVIYIKAGTYEAGYGWGGLSPARSIAVYGYGGSVYLSLHAPGLVWAATGGTVATYEAVYATAIGSVVDSQNPDAYGDFIPLAYQTSIALVDANPGSFWYDSGKIYVCTLDSRTPDARILCYHMASNGLIDDAVTYYLENLNFHGGATAPFRMTANPGALYAKNCSFKYSKSTSANNGFTASAAATGTIIFQNCITSRNSNDGFHIDGLTNLALIDCISRNNGTPASNIANGYSSHAANSTLIIGGEMFNCYGRIIQDIGVGQLLWILGTYLHDGAAAAADINYAIAGAGSIMWVNRCRSSGSATDLEAGAGSTLYYRHLDPYTPVTAGAGTVTPY